MKELFERLYAFRLANQTADVDLYGAESIMKQSPSKDPKQQRFELLIALMLSSQTHDKLTSATMTKIRHLLTPAKLLECQDLEDLLKPVSFYRTKAKNIKLMCSNLGIEQDIPNTLEELQNIKGVGPKMALLAMQIGFGQCLGISVDTHVHRVAARLGWSSGKTPEVTRRELEDKFPEHLWNKVNWTLVGFGQTVCKAKKPQCQSCPISDACPKIGA